MKADTACISMSKEALKNQAYKNRARLSACEVGVNITSLKNAPTPLFEEPLEFITHGYIFERLQYMNDVR